MIFIIIINNSLVTKPPFYFDCPFIKIILRKPPANLLCSPYNSSRSKLTGVHPFICFAKYINENKQTSLTTLIFSIRSRTLDIKEWSSWKYTDLSCVKCDETKTMDHFVSCQHYGEKLGLVWTEIDGDNIQKHIQIGTFVQKRHKIRQDLISQQEDGQASTSGSTVPGTL